MEGRAEPTLPPRLETLIAEFSGEVEEERGERLKNWRVLHDVNKNMPTKAFQEIETTVRNSFVIKHSYAYRLRNFENRNTTAFHNNHRSPLFDKMSEARQWLEEQEEIRREGENIDRPNTKWSFEENLMVMIKIIEDL